MRSFSTGLNPSSLRAFYAAASELNFTRAARLVGLTQSGISQHISTLEAELRAPLFLRVGRRVLLTEPGLALLKYVEQYLDHTDSFLESLGRKTRELRGWVRYAMPESCLMTPHFQTLLARHHEFEGIDLSVRIEPSERVGELLVSGEIDFGFSTRRLSHPDLVLKEFAAETYVLAGATIRRWPVSDLTSVRGLPFVTYPGMDVLFEIWEDRIAVRKKGLGYNQLQLKGSITSLRAAITMVECGLGLSVFPLHCVEAQIKNRTLQIFELGAKPPQTSPIYLSKLSRAGTSARVEKVMEVFWEMVRKK